MNFMQSIAWRVKKLSTCSYSQMTFLMNYVDDYFNHHLIGCIKNFVIQIAYKSCSLFNTWAKTLIDFLWRQDLNLKSPIKKKKISSLDQLTKVN